MPMDRFLAIDAFVRVAESLSFAQAARQLRVSRSVVTSSLAIPARQLRARVPQERGDRPRLLDALPRFVDDASKPGALARCQRMSCVAKLPTDDPRQLIFDVFPVA